MAPRTRISNLYTQKMHEVQKHMSLTEHGYLGYAVITNKKFWDGLPADVRGQLEKAMKESTDYANKIAKEENDGRWRRSRPAARPQSTADAGRAPGHQEGDGEGARGDGVAHRQGPSTRSTRKPASIRPSSDPQPLTRGPSLRRSGGPLSFPVAGGSMLRNCSTAWRNG
jgi:hypothetical protein